MNNDSDKERDGKDSSDFTLVLIFGVVALCIGALWLRFSHYDLVRANGGSTGFIVSSVIAFVAFGLAVGLIIPLLRLEGVKKVRASRNMGFNMVMSGVAFIYMAANFFNSDSSMVVLGYLLAIPGLIIFWVNRKDNDPLGLRKHIKK